MAKKKVMLFIVEGPTDETSLSTVLNRIFSSSTVKFQVVHGDVLTRDFMSSDKIVAAVWDQVKAFMGEIYKKSDICRIVHLTDMDGVFVPDDAVVEDMHLKNQSSINRVRISITFRDSKSYLKMEAIIIWLPEKSLFSIFTISWMLV